MVENKYQIKVVKFGAVNWVGFWSLYVKEVSRFFVVWAQTLLSPLVSSLLFLSVLTLAIGNERGNVLGFPFISFLAPGLIVMSMIQQSFSHTVSSFMISKMQGNIIDTLFAPLTAVEVTFALILAAVTRSLFILVISIIAFSFIVDLNIHSVFYIFIGSFIGSFILGALGFITGLWAEKFDHTATITNFIITPLSFLSGVFYSIDKLPEFFQLASKANPFFYIIDITRFGFLGTSDGSIVFGIVYLLIISFIMWFLSYYLYKIGYKIKS